MIGHRNEQTIVVRKIPTLSMDRLARRTLGQPINIKWQIYYTRWEKNKAGGNVLFT